MQYYACIFKSQFHWWFVENHIGCFCIFVPIFWEDGWDLWMILSHSVNAGWLVGILRCVGDRKNPIGCNWLYLNFLCSEMVGTLKHCSHPFAHSCSFPFTFMLKGRWRNYSYIDFRESWNFSSMPKDGSDIHRFSNRKWVLIPCTVGNLWISQASPNKLGKFQHRSALPNIKYNCAVLFWVKCIGCLLHFQIHFLINHQCKTSISNPRKCSNLFMFLQDVTGSSQRFTVLAFALPVLVTLKS